MSSKISGVKDALTVRLDKESKRVKAGMIHKVWCNRKVAYLKRFPRFYDLGIEPARLIMYKYIRNFY